MTDPARLLAAVDAAVIADESRVRFGGRRAIDWPSDGPPPHVLAGRAFPPEVLDRRLRQLEAAVASGGAGPLMLADELALLVRDDRMLQPGLERLVAALRLGPDDDSERDRALRLLDVAAHDSGSQLTPPAQVPDSFARLQAAHGAGEPYFGRRRGRRPIWALTRRAVRWSGEAKRRVRP